MPASFRFARRSGFRFRVRSGEVCQESGNCGESLANEQKRPAPTSVGMYAPSSGCAHTGLGKQLRGSLGHLLRETRQRKNACVRACSAFGRGAPRRPPVKNLWPAAKSTLGAAAKGQVVAVPQCLNGCGQTESLHHLHLLGCCGKRDCQCHQKIVQSGRHAMQIRPSDFARSLRSTIPRRL